MPSFNGRKRSGPLPFRDDSFPPWAPPHLPSAPRIRREIEEIPADLARLADGTGEAAPSRTQPTNPGVYPSEILKI